MASIWVGTSGYAYSSWRGRFYPAGLGVKQELGYASRKFSSIEINRSFYSLLSPATCAAWRAAVPADYVFALKGSRFITHNKKLRDADQALANFFASGPLALGEMLGPVVWQLSQKTRFDAERLESFFTSLPRSLRAAAQLAAKHDERVKHGAFLEVQRDRPIRHVLEPRHESFATSECAALLRRHNVALAVSDSPDWEAIEEPTADFMYLRLHGSQRLYASQYTDRELDSWAEHIRAYRRGAIPKTARRIDKHKPAAPLDVYVYFDNDTHAYAPHDALRLMDRLSRKAPTRGPRPAPARHTAEATRR